MSRYGWQWHEDSLTVVMLLALSQGPNKLRKLARRHGAFEEGTNRSMDEVFQRLGEIVPGGGELTKEIGKDLDTRFGSTLLKVRSLGAEEVKKLEMKWPVPLMWAAVTDDREEVRMYGRNLTHALIRRALREAFAGQGMGSGPGEAFESLQKQNRAQAAELENLRRELLSQEWEKKKIEVEGIKRVSRLPEPCPSSVELGKMGQGRLEREVKKLGHALNREREKVQELTRRLFESESCRPPAERERAVDAETAGFLSPEECPCADEAGSSACGELCPADDVLCGECPLRGLRVAVVGGLQRMMPAYRKTVSQLGAEFLSHDGKVKNGRYQLRNVVCGADIVVFITSVNSHGALDVVKDVCKRNGKKFLAPKETGPETLGRLLMACCA